METWGDRLASRSETCGTTWVSSWLSSWGWSEHLEFPLRCVIGSIFQCWRNVCVCIPVCTWKRWCSLCSLGLPTWFSSRVSHWLVTCQVGQVLASQAPRIHFSLPPQHWGYMHEPTCPDLFCVVLGLNSGPPHDCMAGTLPTKPSPQPLRDKSSIPSLPGTVITVPCSDFFQ